MSDVSKINGYGIKDGVAREQIALLQSRGASPEVANFVADMEDQTKIYVYTGSESGYVAGNWYYYDEEAWVSGGVYGTDGGLSENSRNLLKYILERVVYTEQGMDTYVNALYYALAHEGSTITTYTITNALVHVTNSNTSAGINPGQSYSATLTADTDYEIDSVTVTMGGVDITSTAYSNGTITIASVTGDIVITASANDWDFTWSYSDGLPNNNGLTLANSGSNTISITSNGLSVATENSSSSSVIYKYEDVPLTPYTKTIAELVVKFTAFSANSGSGVRNYAGLGGSGGSGGTAKQIAQCSFSQNGIQYMGSASGWSTLSSTPLELNTEYTIRVEQVSGSADIYLNGTLVGTLTDFRETVSYPQFSIYRGVSALIKSFNLKFIV